VRSRLRVGGWWIPPTSIYFRTAVPNHPFFFFFFAVFLIFQLTEAFISRSTRVFWRRGLIEASKPIGGFWGSVVRKTHVKVSQTPSMKRSQLSSTLNDPKAYRLVFIFPHKGTGTFLRPRVRTPLRMINPFRIWRFFQFFPKPLLLFI